MPKLEGIEEKYIHDVRVDKENDDVFFNDETHTYYNKDTMEKYISVTSLIHLYSNEFDEEFWSAYKALEELMDMDLFLIVKKSLLATKKFNPKLLKKLNIDENLFLEKQNAIKEEYNRKRIESCERGTKIHAAFENSMYNKKHFDFEKFGYKDLSGDYECVKDYYKLDLKKGVYPEFLISLRSRDGVLGVAGQIDLLIIDGDDVVIVDYKTNKEIKKQSYYNRSKKSYEMMKFPLNNLQDFTFNHYQLQLSLYMYLLQQINPNYKCKSLRLIHIDHDGVQHEYDCEYLKSDVERMLKHYKKRLKVESEYNNLKPVVS